MRNKSGTPNLETHAKIFKLSDANITELKTIATALGGISEVAAFRILLRLVATIMRHNPAQAIKIIPSLGSKMENPGEFSNLDALDYDIHLPSQGGINA